jgi:hypothetical protein
LLPGYHGYRRYPLLKGAFQALVAVAQSGELTAKATANMKAASAELPEPKKASKVSIAGMKNVLRAADCLYDSKEIWEQLRATNVPEIPESVIREAYEKGGRVILRCSSISEKTVALRKAGRAVVFRGIFEQSDYQESVSTRAWIVVPSHIDPSTLDRQRIMVVTSEMPPTPEDWFAAIAYARLDGGRQPKGCEGLHAFTAEAGTVVGSGDSRITVLSDGIGRGRRGRSIGAARFGPPRN